VTVGAHRAATEAADAETETEAIATIAAAGVVADEADSTAIASAAPSSCRC
jgi:hypothetical protein